MSSRGELIRGLLRKHELSQNWLLKQLARCGIKTDKSELSITLSNKRKGTKADLILATSFYILEDYENRMCV